MAFFASPLLLGIKAYGEGAGYVRFKSSGILCSFAFEISASVAGRLSSGFKV